MNEAIVPQVEHRHLIRSIEEAWSLRGKTAIEPLSPISLLWTLRCMRSLEIQDYRLVCDSLIVCAATKWLRMERMNEIDLEEKNSTWKRWTLPNKRNVKLRHRSRSVPICAVNPPSPNNFPDLKSRRSKSNRRQRWGTSGLWKSMKDNFLLPGSWPTNWHESQSRSTYWSPNRRKAC